MYGMNERSTGRLCGLLLVLGLMLPCAHARAGQMVDVGGHRLWLECEGQGAPAVILEPGLGGLSLEWINLQRLLSGYTRVCRYDRAGYGRSDYRNVERSAAGSARELRRLLHSAGIGPRWVLVGHSYGGLISQYLARNWPGEVAGLVLVESSHPEQAERFELPPYRLVTAPRGRVSEVRYGIPRLPEGLPEGTRDQALRMLTQGKTRYTMGEELIGFRTSEAQVRNSPPLPPLPVVVISRGRQLWQGPRSGLLEELWQQLQHELAQMSPHSAHLVGLYSGHHVHLDQPLLTARGVLLAIAAARGGMTPARAYACRREVRGLWQMNSVEILSNHLRDQPGMLSPYLRVGALPPVLIRTELEPRC
ncbi:MAG: alpha/beta hydrolase [Gammaproteobacteria bacterium]|nr:MAG: alpha/beta hydrolase [Gammaproteobacteria bacterium]